MRDTELYRAILGLTPRWTVGSVELDLPVGQVIVRVDAGAGPFACPEGRECGGALRQAAATVAAPRHLSVDDVDRRARARNRLRGPWGEVDPGAVGGAGIAVHGVVRTAGE
jgi:hypothetical protein